MAMSWGLDSFHGLALREYHPLPEAASCNSQENRRRTRHFPFSIDHGWALDGGGTFGRGTAHANKLLFCVLNTSAVADTIDRELV